MTEYIQQRSRPEQRQQLSQWTYAGTAAAHVNGGGPGAGGVRSLLLAACARLRLRAQMSTFSRSQYKAEAAA